MKKYLLITALFISLISSSFAITKEEEAKMTRIEKMRLMAMRGNTYGMFGWQKDLTLENFSFLGCLDENGILIVNDKFISNRCGGIDHDNNYENCSSKTVAKYEKMKGNIVFVRSRGGFAPYFRPLTKEEAYELFGDRGTPVCISYKYRFY